MTRVAQAGSDHRDARRIVRTLAFQIATRLPDYRKLLLTLPEIQNTPERLTVVVDRVENLTSTQRQNLDIFLEQLRIEVSRRGDMELALGLAGCATAALLIRWASLRSSWPRPKRSLIFSRNARRAPCYTTLPITFSAGISDSC